MFLFIPGTDENYDRDSDLEKLLRETADGNRQAFEDFYIKTKASVFAYALSVMKNFHDAEEITSDCFVGVYRAASGYKPQGKPMAWVITIAKNLCLQRMRRKEYIDLTPFDDVEECISDRSDVTSDDRLILDFCLRSLSDEERNIVVLHAVSGLRHREIASILDLPLATVLSKYNRSLKKMKKYIENEG